MNKKVMALAVALTAGTMVYQAASYSEATVWSAASLRIAADEEALIALSADDTGSLTIRNNMAADISNLTIISDNPEVDPREIVNLPAGAEITEQLDGGDYTINAVWNYGSAELHKSIVVVEPPPVLE